MTDTDNQATINASNEEYSDLTDKLEENCQIEGNFEHIAKTFDELNLKPEIVRGICAYGFIRPSPIQSRAIIPCVKEQDVIAQAQSGTGKTATFVISTLQRIDTDPSHPVETQALVLAPTRELASQIKNVFTEIGQFCNLKCQALIGGTSVMVDVGNLKMEGAHVIVGTPGRVLHMIKNNSLSCSKIKILVLDEADEMLNRGFLEQIRILFGCIPTNVQVILVSATITDSVTNAASAFMRNPVKIFVKKEKLSLQGIKQFFFATIDRNSKVDVILEFLSVATIPQTVIFVNSQKDATLLYDALSNSNLEVSFLHAGLPQADRDAVMKKFRAEESKILVTTNLISRGIDVQGVSLVINFDPPRDYETYIHRIGRSGRYGRAGVSISLVVQDEMKILKEIETYYTTQIQELPKNFFDLIFS